LSVIIGQWMISKPVKETRTTMVLLTGEQSFILRC
jgi:hypothetical protein